MFVEQFITIFGKMHSLTFEIKSQSRMLFGFLNIRLKLNFLN